MDIKQQLATEINGALVGAFGQTDITAQDIERLLAIPPETAMGDYAFPCFTLAKALRKAPPAIAQALAGAWAAPDLAAAQCLGGYLNLYLNRRALAQRVVPGVLAAPGAWGASDKGKGKTICIDYSSINIAKRFHIGHLSTTMIGHALRRIYTHLGYSVVGINHLGDWGTQFGKMIAAFKRWGDQQAVEQGGVVALGELYVRFHDEAEQNPALEDEGRAWFKKIEDGDPEAVSIFNWFKDITLSYAQGVYQQLGVDFDSYAGESFYNDKMGRVVDELRAKDLLVLSEGAYVVDLEAYKMPPCIILKKDGATLYATRDIAAALYRKETYDFDKSLYVVAYHQDLHFRQLFKVVELMGYPWHKDLVHVSYGMVSYEGQALSTRKGHTVNLDEVLTRAVEKAAAIIEEKSPQLADKETVARQVGIGALVYAALANNRIKDMDFWWDRALNFDGETAPYVQYTHARCCSLLAKAPAQLEKPQWEALTDDEAHRVLLLLSRFPEVVLDAQDKHEPSMITRHTTLIAQAYNKYYYEHRILDGQPGEIAARVQLTQAVRDVIKTGLWLIGIEAPVKM